MPEHRFQIGDLVDFTNSHVMVRAAPANCEILRLLPVDGSDPQYRVKCSAETFERVVRESQLREVTNTKTRASR